MIRVITFIFIMFGIQSCGNNEHECYLNEINLYDEIGVPPKVKNGQKRIEFYAKAIAALGGKPNDISRLNSPRIEKSVKDELLSKYGKFYMYSALNQKNYSNVDFFLKHRVSPFLVDEYNPALVGDIILMQDRKALALVLKYYPKKDYPILERIERYIERCPKQKMDNEK